MDIYVHIAISVIVLLMVVGSVTLLPAFLGVAGKTGRVHIRFVQITGGCSAMRIMTTAAGHFAFVQRMGEGFARLGTLFRVTRKTGLILCRRMAHRILGAMHGVTTGTANVV